MTTNSLDGLPVPAIDSMRVVSVAARNVSDSEEWRYPGDTEGANAVGRAEVSPWGEGFAFTNGKAPTLIDGLGGLDVSQPITLDADMTEVSEYLAARGDGNYL